VTDQTTIDPKEVDGTYDKLKKDADSGGYYLNHDIEFAKELVTGLLVNEKRYGYPACPCRLASGVRAEDLDIICPCDYRDPDLADYGTCYCGLYVSKAVIDGKKELAAIPERRLPVAAIVKPKPKKARADVASLPLPIWRCRVCGYLCAREGPPEICPICKAKKDRFERFL
jgi:ferredoxin-thioredoxin reductase catalytic chain